MLVLPPSLQPYLQGYSWRKIAIGESRATVHRLVARGRSEYILKSQLREPLHGLRCEVERLRWLHGRARVPAVVDFVEDATHDYLLMAALPGVDAATVSLPPHMLVGVLADALQTLHCIDVVDCPFRHTISDSIAKAEALLAAGRVAVDDFNPENLGRSPASMLDELIATRPSTEGQTFTHGDFCLPNVIIHEGRLSGLVDVGFAGVGDPYRDLALIGRSLQRNLGAGWVDRFFQLYGLAAPDWDRLRFFRLLDEFF